MVSEHLSHHWPSTIQQMASIHNDIIKPQWFPLHETSSRTSLSIDSLYEAQGNERFLIMDLGLKPNVFGIIMNFCPLWTYKTITLSKVSLLRHKEAIQAEKDLNITAFFNTLIKWFIHFHTFFYNFSKNSLISQKDTKFFWINDLLSQSLYINDMTSIFLHPLMETAKPKH